MCDFCARDKTSQKISSTAAHRPNPSCRSVVPIRRAQFTSMSKCAWLPSHASASLPSKWWPSSTCVLSLASSSSTSSATDVLTECAIPSIWDGHRKHNRPINVWRQNKFYRDYFTTTAHCAKSIKRALNLASLLVLKNDFFVKSKSSPDPSSSATELKTVSVRLSLTTQCSWNLRNFC